MKCGTCKLRVPRSQESWLEGWSMAVAQKTTTATKRQATLKALRMWHKVEEMTNYQKDLVIYTAVALFSTLLFYVIWAVSPW